MMVLFVYVYVCIVALSVLWAESPT